MERYPMFLGRKNHIVKITILPNAIYRLNAIPIKLPMTIFTTRTKNFTIHMETQKTLNSQSSLEEEEWSWRNQPSWLQTILQSHSHQESTVLAHTQKKTEIGQWNKIESLEINHAPIFGKGGKNIQWRKDSLFNKRCWDNWTATCKRKN